MVRDIPGPVQIRPTLLGAKGLSSRLAVNKDSMQYKFMTRVISSVKKLARTQTNEIILFLWIHEIYIYYLVNHDFKAVLNLFC